MDILKHADVNRLSRHSGRWCVSIYLPTHPTWPANTEDSVHFDRLVSEAAARLLALGERPADIREHLAPLARLTNDHLYWQMQRNGLAIFLAPGFFQTFRLPLPCTEEVMVAERFAIRPLLHHLTNNARFFILAIEQNGARLIRASRFDADLIPLPQIPGSVAQATGIDEPQRGKQFHAGVPIGRGTQHAAVIHTSGVRTEGDKQYIREYCTQIDQAVKRILRNENAPLVLAGVDSTLAIYRIANSYPHTLDDELRGSVQRMSEHDLRERCWPIIEMKLIADRQPLMKRFRQAIGTGSASVDLKDILIHAFDGTVADLFLHDNGPIWGRFNQTYRDLTMYAEPEGDDEDLLDLAAVHTLRHGGSVHALPREQMPEDAPIAALYRY